MRPAREVPFVWVTPSPQLNLKAATGTRSRPDSAPQKACVCDEAAKTPCVLAPLVLCSWALWIPNCRVIPVPPVLGRKEKEPQDRTVQTTQAESKVIIFHPVLRMQFSSSVLCLMQGPRTGVPFLLAALRDVKPKIAWARKRSTYKY